MPIRRTVSSLLPTLSPDLILYTAATETRASSTTQILLSSLNTILDELADWPTDPTKLSTVTSIMSELAPNATISCIFTCFAWILLELVESLSARLEYAQLIEPIKETISKTHVRFILALDVLQRDTYVLPPSWNPEEEEILTVELDSYNSKLSEC